MCFGARLVELFGRCFVLLASFSVATRVRTVANAYLPPFVSLRTPLRPAVSLRPATRPVAINGALADMSSLRFSHTARRLDSSSLAASSVWTPSSSPFSYEESQKSASEAKAEFFDALDRAGRTYEKKAFDLSASMELESKLEEVEKAGSLCTTVDLFRKLKPDTQWELSFVSVLSSEPLAPAVQELLHEKNLQGEKGVRSVSMRVSADLSASIGLEIVMADDHIETRNASWAIPLRSITYIDDNVLVLRDHSSIYEVLPNLVRPAEVFVKVPHGVKREDAVPRKLPWLFWRPGKAEEIQAQPMPLSQNQLNHALFAILDTEPHSPERFKRIAALFHELDLQKKGVLEIDTVLSMMETTWQDWLKDFGDKTDILQKDAASVLMALDSDKDGSLTLNEFAEYLETLDEASRAFEEDYGDEVLDSDIQRFAQSSDAQIFWDWMGQKLLDIKEGIAGGIKAGASNAKETASLLGGDYLNAGNILKRAAKQKSISKTDVAALKRLITDTLMLVPVAAVIITPLTPMGTALILKIMKERFPSYFPSQFLDSRITLARALKAMKERRGALEDERRESVGLKL